MLAAKAGVPAVPVAHNAGEVWARNAFVKSPGEITVSIGPAIDPTGRKAEEINRPNNGSRANRAACGRSATRM